MFAGALVVTIGLGTLLLQLPAAQAGPRLSWIDVLFTATSAACVTGLAVADTASQFTPLGQAILLILIQIGGLGVMTIGTMVLLAFGRRPMTIAHHLVSGLAPDQQTIRVRDIVGTVVLTTLTVELCGTLALFWVFSAEYAGWHATWLAVFHSVSAFCNAGFSLWPDSLSQYVTHPLLNLTLMILIVIGGLGFVVVIELRVWLASHFQYTAAGAGILPRLSLHSKLILTATGIAFIIGTGVVWILEAGNVLIHYPWYEQLLIASFHSVSIRTPGFHTVDIAALSNPTLLLMMGFMFIGAGPGSMAGGIKLTTAAVVIALVMHRIRGNREVHLFQRAIGERTLQRAVVLAVLAFLLIRLA